MSNTGKYNKRVKIVFKGAKTATELGGFSFGVGTEKTVWSEVEQLSMSEQLRNGLESTDISYRFKFIYGSVQSVSEIDHIVYKNKTCRILSVKNVGEDNRELEVLANEQR